MRLDCILDICPKDKQFVNHIKCCRCDLNPLSDNQPEFAKQECNHPEATHKPDYERWQNMKACGVEPLRMMVTR